MIKYNCTRCGKAINVSQDPELILERDEKNRERIYQTVPELCAKCRSDRFWSDFNDHKDNR